MRTDLPFALGEIVDDFQAVSARDRLQMLLEFSQELPDLPARLTDHPELLERVEECQSPLFLKVEVDDTPSDPDERAVHLFFHAPAESPTTKGFAGILAEGLDGATVDTIMNVPADLPGRFGLTDAVSPLRMRGMGAMLARIKHQIAALTAPAHSRPN
ncbi:SufE family protein [Spelaeicoccus albus]|uniref:Cysteine desulfuration protein SufE n=1 Tax=Spelaeicoccus albus TaxID=1280376 RepID=A0A7Z0D3H0_9MICO|nr:SufE family protein [Spelaeicoccus albus]NYI68188.1 cysteine desulfuration protein SufE [Spelaeicoccus albus]